MAQHKSDKLIGKLFVHDVNSHHFKEEDTKGLYMYLGQHKNQEHDDDYSFSMLCPNGEITFYTLEGFIHTFRVLQ